MSGSIYTTEICNSIMISSPRVRKKKQFGDDFYVYEKKSRKRTANSDVSVLGANNLHQHGSSVFGNKELQSPKRISNSGMNVTRAPNELFDPESKKSKLYCSKVCDSVLHDSGLHGFKHNYSQCVEESVDSVPENESIDFQPYAESIITDFQNGTCEMENVEPTDSVFRNVLHELQYVKPQSCNKFCNGLKLKESYSQDDETVNSVISEFSEDSESNYHYDETVNSASNECGEGSESDFHYDDTVNLATKECGEDSSSQNLETGGFVVDEPCEVETKELQNVETIENESCDSKDKELQKTRFMINESWKSGDTELQNPELDVNGICEAKVEEVQHHETDMHEICELEAEVQNSKTDMNAISKLDDSEVQDSKSDMNEVYELEKDEILNCKSDMNEICDLQDAGTHNSISDMKKNCELEETCEDPEVQNSKSDMNKVCELENDKIQNSKSDMNKICELEDVGVQNSESTNMNKNCKLEEICEDQEVDNKICELENNHMQNSDSNMNKNCEFKETCVNAEEKDSESAITECCESVDQESQDIEFGILKNEVQNAGNVDSLKNEPDELENTETKPYKPIEPSIQNKPRRGRKPKAVVLNSSKNCGLKKENLNGCNSFCFSCKEGGDLQKCSLESCDKLYHSKCLKNLPGLKTEINGCSLHCCLTCYHTNPKSTQNSKGDMFKCFKCPTAFHKQDSCTIPGAVILTGDVMSCPDHFNPENYREFSSHVNLNFCVCCGMNKDLIFCDFCPCAVHVKCQTMAMVADEKYKCDRCIKKEVLHFGDIVWTKVYNFRWWPAKILNSSDVAIQKMNHFEGEFPIMFFGTGELYWIQKSRVYPFVYKEVDMESQDINHNFKKAVPVASYTDAINAAIKATRDVSVVYPSSSKKYPPYKHIKSNRPIGSVQIYAPDEFDYNPCNCKAKDPNPCGYEAICLNRSMCTECTPGVCAAGDGCQNQKFQKREYAPAKPYWTGVRGWGLQALADIRKGHFVSEYCGDLIDEEECQRRIQQKQATGDTNFYFCTLDSNRIIDAGPKGNFSRFMNHSCEPNCVTQKWIVSGDARVGIFAKYDIPAGSELTFDYQMDFSHFKKLKCNCGSKKCSGLIGKKPQSGVSHKYTSDSDMEVSGDESKVSLVDKKGKGSKKKVDDDSLKKRTNGSMNVKNSTKKDKILCFKCKTGGKLVNCSRRTCGKSFHIRCLKSKIGVPSTNWECPCHFCVKCQKKSTYQCFECPKSYCDTHVDKKPKSIFFCPKHVKN